MIFNRDFKYYILGKVLVSFILFGCSNSKILSARTNVSDENNYAIISKSTISWFNSPIPNGDSGFEVNIVCQKLKSLDIDSLFVNGKVFPLKIHIKKDVDVLEFEDMDQVIINTFLNFPKGEIINTGILFFHKDSLRISRRIDFANIENLNKSH